MRFPGGKPLPLGLAIKKSLEDRDVHVTPALEPGPDNRFDEIAEKINECDVFVVFGTEDYGGETGNMMCSNREFQFAVGEGKSIAHIKMCEKIETAGIRMGLQNHIWKDQAEGADALATWIIGLSSN